VVTHQLQVERRTGKVRQPETDVLPLSHATNYLCILHRYELTFHALSALKLLVGRQEGHPACKKVSGGVLAWLSVWSEVQTCKILHILADLPLTVSCFCKIQIGFTFLIPTHPGSHGPWAVKQVCV